jgi:hypothetical protein
MWRKSAVDEERLSVSVSVSVSVAGSVAGSVSGLGLGLCGDKAENVEVWRSR